MESAIKKLALIGVSEYIVVFVLIISVMASIALTAATVNFQQIINPAPAPTITAIIGDPRTRAVLVIGSTSLENAPIRVYAFSDPIEVNTTSDSTGTFVAAFDAKVLPPGYHQFTAAVVLSDQETTEATRKVAVQVHPDYTIEPAVGSEIPTVKISNADEATSTLLRHILRNQRSVKSVAAADVPAEQSAQNSSRVIEIALLLIIALQSILLILQRAKRKKAAGQSFFHLGRGFYHIPPSRPDIRPAH